MRMTYPNLAINAVFAATISLATAPALAQAPADLVRPFYTGEHFETDPEIRDAFFAGAAAEMLAKNEKQQEIEEGVGCIDFSLAFDAQDYDQEETNRTLKLDETVSGDTSKVVARFDLFGQPRVIDWTLAMTPLGWRITDIASPETGWRLSGFDCGGQ